MHVNLCSLIKFKNVFRDGKEPDHYLRKYNKFGTDYTAAIALLLTFIGLTRF